MTVHLTVAGFLQPANILKYRHLFARTQWLSHAELEAFQFARLREIVDHAYHHVPYYRDLFRLLKLTPADIRQTSDLRKLPRLSKAVARREHRRLQADNCSRFRPAIHRTSGSTGAEHAFLLDRETNAVEFAYYWRYWNWAGYRLGDRFAEFSSSYFSREGLHQRPFVRQPFTGRLLLNSLSFTRASAMAYAQAIERHGARFLKGLPSVLGFFARFLRDAGKDRLGLAAIFTTGELLLPSQRALLESCLGGSVYDSYGQMERLVAISECSQRRMHVNSDYGLLEFGADDEDGESSETGRSSRGCLGTSLYNRSMPLLRYELGDVIEPEASGVRCACGRGLPLVRAITGRVSDSLATPDGRIVPTLFLVFRDVAGIEAGQFVHEAADRLSIRVVASEAFTETEHARLLTLVRWHVGPSMALAVARVRPEELVLDPSGKLKMIVSRVEARQLD
jgi:phenylacetate-CoA ligase